MRAGKKPATVRRSVATIARAHVGRLSLESVLERGGAPGTKNWGRETSAREDEAYPLGWQEIKEFIESAGKGLRADRDDGAASL
jgi:hypothetical protein